MLTYIIKEKGNLKKAYAMRKASKKIDQLDLFDEKYYLKKYPDVKKSRLSPLNHYLYHGFKEGKQPGRLFDGNKYLKEYSDVNKSGLNPLVHYVLHGKKEGRKTFRGDYNALKQDIRKLNKKINYQNSILNSYNKLFNDLYIFHEIKPKGILKDVQDLCLQMLIFVDNICAKYNIPYWLDFGSLLGPVRHGGFLPWDDDVDIGMLNTDFERFIEVIEKEIANNNLEGFMRIREKRKYDDSISSFIQIMYFKEPFVNNFIACIDVSPYDYIDIKENHDKDKLREVIYDRIDNTIYEFQENNYFNDKPVEEVRKSFKQSIGISDEPSNYIVTAGVYPRPKNLKLYKYDEIFPLQKIKFEDERFLAANKPKSYLVEPYNEEFMKLPKRVFIHNRAYSLANMDIDNLHELIVEEIERVRKANANFNIDN